MVDLATLLQEVVVSSGAAIRMKGDTLEYTADSFALRPNANVEELLKRMPGIQVQKNGKIIAQGKEVKKVLVDGDEFFSDDPALALKYLSANAIDKVQVFDGRSEQAIFTGIDDGKRTKTINLKLKKNSKNGYFGKLATGSDGKDFYNNEAMAALFKNAKKISVFGLASKIGREGIPNNELTKYVGKDYETIVAGTSSIYNTDNDYENENYYGNGLPAVLNGGFHYSNKWKQNRQKLFTNYRVKQINAAGWSNNRYTELLPEGTIFFGNSENKEATCSFVQKASGSFEMPIDSLSTLKISINGGSNKNTVTTSSISKSVNEKVFLVNDNNSFYRNSTDSRSIGSNIIYNKKFRKE